VTDLSSFEGVGVSLHLPEVGTDPVSEMLWFTVFRKPDDGQLPKTRVLKIKSLGSNICRSYQK
jgi:hypothetical protein